MDQTHTVQGCRWAVPTLDRRLPTWWLEAWDAPWGCRCDGVPRTLESTRDCLACPRWEVRAEPGEHWVLAQLGL